MKFIGTVPSSLNSLESSPQELLFYNLKLAKVDIKMKANGYRISNLQKEMKEVTCLAMSSQGQLFESTTIYEIGSLLRIWIYIPNYWQRKSKLVAYSHTLIPEHFQIFSKVTQCENKYDQFQTLCQTMTIDSVDEQILNEYIKISGVKK